MAEPQQGPQWTAGAARGLMTSLNFFTHRIGQIAERMDEFGSDFMGHVDLYEDPGLAARASSSSRPFDILEAEAYAANYAGLYSLPLELQHLIILHTRPNVEDLAALSRVSRAWYLMSRDVQVWNEMYARGMAEWSFLHGPRIRSPAEGATSGSSSPIPSRARSAWFTTNSLLFRTVTQPIFAKIEAFRNPPKPVSPSIDTHNNEEHKEDRLVPLDGQQSWWIRRHLREHFWNTEDAINVEVSLPPKSTDLLSKLISPTVYTIPVFGPGVGGAQKTVFDLVSHVPNNVTMLAGVRGVGTGIGFHAGSSVFKLSAIHDPPQPFHTILTQDPTWRTLFRESSLHIYAVSDKVTLTESKADLASFLALDFSALPDAAAPQEAVLSSSSSSNRKPKTPLLVMSFVTGKPTSEVASELGLLELPDDHVWAIKTVDTAHRARDMLYCLKWFQSVLN